MWISFNHTVYWGQFQWERDTLQLASGICFACSLVRGGGSGRQAFSNRLIGNILSEGLSLPLCSEATAGPFPQSHYMKAKMAPVSQRQERGLHPRRRGTQDSREARLTKLKTMPGDGRKWRSEGGGVHHSVATE